MAFIFIYLTKSNINAKLEKTHLMRRTKSLKKYFKKIFLAIDPETRTLLKQKLYLERTTIWNKMKFNLLKHDNPDPKTWDDDGWHYGHVGIKITRNNICYAKKEFLIPELKIIVCVGPVIEIGQKAVPGMRIVWKKLKPE